jgi:hypothetical protein
MVVARMSCPTVIPLGFWASVCAELANGGVRDVLIVCCDGLTGFPDAVADRRCWMSRIVIPPA